ncbi:MAG: DUF3617 domain-containing protein [Bacteriovoracaceae bacterium]|nr:DUF3617 domain-containing protein [Bacteriovoracaceae bacterium]
MKMLISSFLTLVFSAHALAGTSMKPGSWKIQTKMSTDGKAQVDPMAAMGEALKKMPAAQRKMVEEAMNKAMKEQGQSGLKMDKDGVTVCYTKDMLDSDLGLKKQYETQKCNISNYIKSDSSISLSFLCPDGAKGDLKMTITDPTHFNGITKMVSAKGVASEIITTAQFVSEKCQ